MKEHLDFLVDQAVTTNPIGLHNTTVGSIDAVIAGVTVPPFVQEALTSQPIEASSVGMAAYGLLVIAGMEIFRRGMNNQVKRTEARDMWNEVTTLYRINEPHVNKTDVSEHGESPLRQPLVLVPAAEIGRET